MKSRILQAIILLVVFILGVALFSSGGGSTAVETNSEYVPPSP